MFQNITEKMNSTDLLFEILQIYSYTYLQSVSNITRLYAERDVAKNVCIRGVEEDRI